MNGISHTIRSKASSPYRLVFGKREDACGGCAHLSPLPPRSGQKATGSSSASPCAGTGCKISHQPSRKYGGTGKKAPVLSNAHATGVRACHPTGKGSACDAEPSAQEELVSEWWGWSSSGRRWAALEAQVWSMMLSSRGAQLASHKALMPSALNEGQCMRVGGSTMTSPACSLARIIGK